MNKVVLGLPSITKAVIKSKRFVQTNGPYEEKWYLSRLSPSQRIHHSGRNTHLYYCYQTVLWPGLVTTGRKVKLEKKNHAKMIEARNSPPQMPTPLTYLEGCAT